MSGERLGRLSLRLDAGYCVVLGVAMAIAAPLLLPVLQVPAPTIVLAGVAVMIWGGAVVWMVARLPLRVALRVVLAANVSAACALATYSTAVAGPLLILSVLAIAADVGLFASSQGVALRRLRTTHAG